MNEFIQELLVSVLVISSTFFLGLSMWKNYKRKTVKSICQESLCDCFKSKKHLPSQRQRLVKPKSRSSEL